MSKEDRPQPESDEAPGVGWAVERLCAVMAALRAEDGCPWDREQDLHTLRSYLLEEAHEVLEVLDLLEPGGRGDWQSHRDELGDLLFQIVFQAEIQREAGRFDVGDVATAIHDKLVRRHPHVFPDASGQRASHRKGMWDEIKAAERAEKAERTGRPSERTGALDGVPHGLPALLRAFRLGQKAHRVGFDWPDHRGVVEKIKEELGELEETLDPIDPQAFEHEVGDLLYAIVNLCRHLDVDPEAALRGTMQRFETRFAVVEQSLAAEGKVAKGTDLDDLEDRWQQAKRQLADSEEQAKRQLADSEEQAKRQLADSEEQAKRQLADSEEQAKRQLADSENQS